MSDARRRQYMRFKAEVLHLRLMQANLVTSGTKQTMVERLLSHESSQQDAARSHSPTDSDQSGSDEGSSSSQHSEEASPAATTALVTSGPSTQPHSMWSRPAGQTHAGDAPLATTPRPGALPRGRWLRSREWILIGHTPAGHSVGCQEGIGQHPSDLCAIYHICLT